MIFSYKLCHNKEDSNNLVLEFEYFFLCLYTELFLTRIGIHLIL